MTNVCATTSALPQNLACFKGSCASGVCVCEPGWVHDFSMFQVANCAMPNWWINFSISLTAGLSGLLLLVGFLYRQQFKHDTRNAVLCAMGTQTFNILSSVVYGADRYASGTWFLFQGIAVGFVFAAVVITFNGFFKVASKALAQPFPRTRLHVAFSIMCVGGSLPFVAAMIGAYVTKSDPDEFNKVVLAFFILMPVHELTGVLMFASVPSQLINIATQIDSNVQSTRHVSHKQLSSGPVAANNSGSTVASTSPKSNSVKSFIRRLKMYRIGMLGMIPVVTGFCWLSAGLFLGLGQLPFNWLIFTCLTLGDVMCGMTILFFSISHYNKPALFTYAASAAVASSNKSHTDKRSTDTAPVANHTQVTAHSSFVERQPSGEFPKS